MKYLMGGVTVTNKNTNVQVVMDTGYVYSTGENWLKLTLLSIVLVLFLLQ